MVPIAVAISLTHQSFGAVILPFHKAIGKACWQKLEKRENFVPPVFEGREGFAQRLTPKRLNFLNPAIQFLRRSRKGSRGIPGT